MNFSLLFVVCCIALAVADQEPTAEEMKELKEYFEAAVKLLGATCENHKTACNAYMDERFDATEENEKNKFIKACHVLIEQYLCQGKKEGEALVDLYKQVEKFVEEI